MLRRYFEGLVGLKVCEGWFACGRLDFWIWGNCICGLRCNISLCTGDRRAGDGSSGVGNKRDGEGSW